MLIKAVKCNNGDAVEMQATVAQTEVDADLSQLTNWIKGNGNYVGTWTTFDESERRQHRGKLMGTSFKPLFLRRKSTLEVALRRPLMTSRSAPRRATSSHLSVHTHSRIKT